MKIVFNLILIFLFLSTLGFAQKTTSYCGTKDGKSPWLIRYQNNKSAFQTRNEETLYLPLTIHILGNDGGGGYFSLTSVMKALCTLNKDFTDSNIQFFVEGDFNYINNTSWNNHAEFQAGKEMMDRSNIDGTINCYIVQNPAGNCGYSYFGTAIALGTSCIRPNDHTWAHELGHFLSLPHTFYGWEGGVSPEQPNPNYKMPAPDTVYIHGNPIQVERVDGSNCNEAADGFCDTPPDYIFSRWNCGDDNLSSEYIDPNGDLFKADGTFFMSYADDACSSRFSNEQILAMRASAIDRQKYYMEDEIDLGIIDTTPELLSPIDSIAVLPTDVLLEWEALDYAENYKIYVSRYKNFSNLDFQGITDENFIRVPKLKNNKHYYWKIYSWGRFSFCNQFTPAQEFVTSLTVSNDDIQNKSNITVFPNFILNHQPIHIQTKSEDHNDISIQIIDITGKSIFQKNFINYSPNDIQISTSNLNKGLYFISIQSGSHHFVEKIIVN